MALLRRYLFNLVLIAGFLFFLYQLSFPYEPGQGPPSEDAPAPPQQQQNYASYDWAKLPLNYPVQDMTPMPGDAPKPLRRIQYDFQDEPATSKQIRESRQSEVKKQFLKCWSNYRQRAWMHDEMTPIAGGFKDYFGGWATTLVDSLDTLWIMGAREEFISAIKDVEAINFGYTNMDKVNMFETNIRHLGGLLSAYELSREDRILNKAKEVGEMLYRAFDTPNHMPLTRWDFHQAGQGAKLDAEENVLIAELGSFTMEFVRLSQATGDPKWFDAANRVVKVLEKDQMKTRLPGMWPIVVNPRRLDLTQDTGFSLGSMADSAYEYLPKTYALLGGVDETYKTMYERAMDTAVKYTLYRPMVPGDPDMLGTGFVRSEEGKAYLNPEFQHLSCYAGGMFALGGKLFDNSEHVSIGRKLTDTCVWAYRSSPAGIMPEVSHLYKCESMTQCKWDEKKWKEEVASRAALGNEKDTTQNIAGLRLPQGFTAISDRRYVLRPEAIESVFIMYRLTGEQSWQTAAWDMWTAIMKATGTDLGNSALNDVSGEPPSRDDSMESFWMAETLKYFYLIFSTPDTISLDDYGKSYRKRVETWLSHVTHTYCEGRVLL
ncbi:seven-hairpin glycosidase [Bimuria novae-zelandiae CBS 107.79]|uniref:alpha-1,2-Mannosidase n=1 Tax=Bimuria novae-zelandiae CBS 107.79 TaxID=1447943 RepID=A0A6A5UV71_9PLEO|nr:seven-hairpin glycosidase [Bimuria novae-zelandiae CBS 107.79]